MSRNRVTVVVLLLGMCALAAKAQAAGGDPGAQAASVTPMHVAPTDQTSSGAEFLQSIAGHVVDMQDHPSQNASVNLIDVLTGHVVASTYAGTSGQFSFANVPAGVYEVVATLGLSETRQRLDLTHTSMPENVMLRLPKMADTSAADAGGAFAVSVAQMQVPNKARKVFRKAQKALEKGNEAEAGQYVANALSLAPNFADALTLRGVLELDHNQLQAACADMEKSVQIDPSNGMNLIALAATYNVLQRYDDALRVVQKGMSLAPAAWQGYFELGKSYLGKGRYMDALKQLGRASDLAPKSFASLHLVKAHAYLALKNYDQSMYELQQYLDQVPHGPQSAQVRSTLQQVRAFAAVPASR